MSVGARGSRSRARLAGIGIVAKSRVFADTSTPKRIIVRVSYQMQQKYKTDTPRFSIFLPLRILTGTSKITLDIYVKVDRERQGVDAKQLSGECTADDDLVF